MFLISVRIFFKLKLLYYKNETDKWQRFVFLLLWYVDSLVCVIRDRPAAIQIEVKSIDDTSNFDEFPDIDLKWRKFSSGVYYYFFYFAHNFFQPCLWALRIELTWHYHFFYLCCMTFSANWLQVALFYQIPALLVLVNFLCCCFVIKESKPTVVVRVTLNGVVLTIEWSWL